MSLFYQQSNLTSNESVYIKTDQIDGETDLKLRKPVNSLNNGFFENEVFLGDDVEFFIDLMNTELNNFNGVIHSIDENYRLVIDKDPIGVENTIWSGCSINKAEIHGLVIAVGPECRLVKNSKYSKKKKITSLDIQINRFAIFLFVMMVIISVTNSSIQGNIRFSFATFLIQAFRFIILLSFLIPISLRMFITVGRFGYGRQISNDDEIEGTLCKNEGIVEELGKIEIVLSDKTGTITQNQMYMDKIALSKGIFNKDAYKDMVSEYYVNKGEINENVFVSLALSFVICNNVILRNDDGRSYFDASSPDEIAMVEYFEQLGFKILERNDREIGFNDLANKEHWYKIKQVFPFESAKKRMGIIVEKIEEDESENSFFLYVKGADSVMKEKVGNIDEKILIEENTLMLASEGLRTLVFARKQLTKKEFEDYQETYKQNLIKSRKQSNEALVIELEKEMTYIGITGVKDLLQENISESFSYIEQAGLKLWVLTGDKLETAKHICLSTGLAKRSRPIKVLEANTDVDLLNYQSSKLSKFDITDVVLMIDGDLFIKASQLSDISFIRFLYSYNYVCFARCTPAHKYRIAQIIKKNLKKVLLAIGDGGNDVGMIQIANVGVGIFGKEGNQAALAADFTINKFEYLCKLIFFHGRNAHRGISAISNFILHRSLIISWIQQIFSILFHMISMPVFDGMLIMLYSAVFTVFPILSVIYDIDIEWHQLRDYLNQYKKSGNGISVKVFLIWNFVSFYQGGAIFISALFLFEDYLSSFVGITFTALILCETFNVIFLVSRCSKILSISTAVTFILYICCVFIFKSDFNINIFAPDFLWRVISVFLIAWLPVFCVQRIALFFRKDIKKLVK